MPQRRVCLEPHVGGDLTLAFGIVLCLAAAVGLARGLSPPGLRRNTLSVVLVVLSLVAAFLFCFGLGSFVRSRQAQSKLQSRLSTSHEHLGSAESPSEKLRRSPGAGAQGSPPAA